MIVFNKDIVGKRVHRLADTIPVGFETGPPNPTTQRAEDSGITDKSRYNNIII